MLTCPPEVKAVSNTKAYQSPLDVPPPPRNLTTRIKAKLRITHCNPLSHTHQTSSSVESEGQCRAPVLVAVRGPSLVQSSCICGVQAHLLLPPPAARYCPTLPHTLLTFVEDWAGRHIHCNRLPTNNNIFPDGAQMFQAPTEKVPLPPGKGGAEEADIGSISE